MIYKFKVVFEVWNRYEILFLKVGVRFIWNFDELYVSEKIWILMGNIFLSRIDIIGCLFIKSICIFDKY